MGRIEAVKDFGFRRPRTLAAGADFSSGMPPLPSITLSVAPDVTAFPLEAITDNQHHAQWPVLADPNVDLPVETTKLHHMGRTIGFLFRSSGLEQVQYCHFRIQV